VSYSISDHAVSRFAERFPGMEIETTLAGAVPFGAQRGNSILLLNGDVAFCVRDGIVTTCMPKDMAVVNMQAQGLGWVPLKTEYEQSVKVQPEPKNWADLDFDRRIGTLDKATLNTMLNMLANATADQMDVLCERNKTKQLASYVVALRDRVAKQTERADQERKMSQGLMQWIKETHGNEVVASVVDGIRSGGCLV
jgi:hypothetical protein